MELNQLISEIEPSKSVTLLAKTKELQKTDPTVVNMTAGEPDFPTPKAICDEAYRQMLAGNTHYSNSRGDQELLERLALKLQTENQAPYTADQIIVTPGAKQAVYVAVHTLTNPGDEVMWLTPGWLSYPAIVKLSGAVPVAVHLDYDEDYRITADLLEQYVTDRTRVLMINYPSNPTGKILSREDLQELKVFLMRHPNIYVISDEIYEKVIYDGRQCISIASDPELFHRVVIINGFSKCSAMTGWRVGYLAGSTEVITAAGKFFQQTMSCTSGFLQKAAVTALDCTEDTERMRQAYERRRNMLVEGLKDIPGIELKCPEGAFYAWVKFDTQKSAAEIGDLLLTQLGIAGIPGDSYGEEKYCTVRFSYACDEDSIARMIEKMKRVGEIL